MAYNTENILSERRKMNMTSCQYSTTDPYSLYAASTRLYPSAAYSESVNIYAQSGMLQQGQTNHLFNSYAYCPQNYFLSNKCQGDGMINFPRVSMASDARRSQLYTSANSAPSTLPGIQMASDYNGLLDASDPVKYTKTAHPFYWRKRGNSVPAEGMTRTKDKYRVVYTEKQRIGLEKEFKENKFITMKKKTALSKELDLSERQIKIWFQNRRAKERRQRRKGETEVNQVVTDETADDSLESPTSFDHADVIDDKLTETDFASSTYSYPVLNGLEQTQCRFQQSGSGSCDNSAKSTLYQSEIERRFSTSPTEWNQNGAPLTKCNVSPFTANPDWNLIYRT